jgi:hypothetical protein
MNRRRFLALAAGAALSPALPRSLPGPWLPLNDPPLPVLRGSFVAPIEGALLDLCTFGRAVVWIDRAGVHLLNPGAAPVLVEPLPPSA